MKHLMLLVMFLLAGFVSDAQAQPREHCRQINKDRARFALGPDPRCGSYGYSYRDYDGDRYYGRHDSLRREAGERALEAGSHLLHGTIDNHLYGRRREIDDRYDRRPESDYEISGDRRDYRRDVEEERDRYRSRAKDLERELRNRDEQYRREESRRIAREKKDLDKRRRELERKDQEIAGRELTLAQRDFQAMREAMRVKVLVTNDSDFPVCIKRAHDGSIVDNKTIPPHSKSWYYKPDLDLIANGSYQIFIQTGPNNWPGRFIPDHKGGLLIAPMDTKF